MITSHRIFDTHMHILSMLSKDPILAQKLATALSNGSLTQCIDIGIDPSDYIERIPILQKLGIAWYSIGIYPSHASSVNLDLSLSTTKLFAQNALLSPVKFPRLVAVGEIGIDLVHDYAEVTVQQELLLAQLNIANGLGLPVIIHNRNADMAVLECIQKCPPIAGGILHCFSSDWDFAVALMDFGFKISFAGNLTYRSANTLREIACRVPIESLLCETDSPYLSPHPFRGQPNWPGQVLMVYECLADQRKTTLEELCLAIEQNLLNLLNLQ